MIQKINLEEVIGRIEEPFHPVEVVKVNDQVVRIARVEENTTGINIRMRMSSFTFLKVKASFS